jgi:hypothetical protein
MNCIQEHGPRLSAKIDELETTLIRRPQVNVPLKHCFAPGVYLREVAMSAGTFIIGHEHKTEHFNVVLSGAALVLIDGVVSKIQAPCVFVSKPGVRKVLFIIETMRWATIHPTTETDIDQLEEDLVVKSCAFLDVEETRLLVAASQPPQRTPGVL